MYVEGNVFSNLNYRIRKEVICEATPITKMMKLLSNILRISITKKPNVSTLCASHRTIKYLSSNI